MLLDYCYYLLVPDDKRSQKDDSSFPKYLTNGFQYSLVCAYLKSMHCFSCSSRDIVFPCVELRGITKWEY